MIIEPKLGLTGILDKPNIFGSLEMPNKYLFGWEFDIENNDISITKLRWFNASDNPKTRRIELFTYPSGDLMAYSDVFASSQEWGSQSLNKDIILKVGNTYRILIKIPANQEYFFGEVSEIKFSNKEIKFKSARYSDDMISMFETKALSEFPDIEYKILK